MSLRSRIRPGAAAGGFLTCLVLAILVYTLFEPAPAAQATDGAGAAATQVTGHSAFAVAHGDGSLPTLPVTTFQAPSYSVWLPAIIKARKLDVAHGFNLAVTEKPGRVAYIDLASGTDQTCLCVAPQTYARFVEQGADTRLLFNLFSFANLAVTTNPAIRTARDLEGHSVATDTGTGQWAVARKLLQLSGVDVNRISVRTAAGPTQIADLTMGRVDAILPAMVDAATLELTDPKRFHVFSIDDYPAWQVLAPGGTIPNIAFGVRGDWLSDPDHATLARRFYSALADAAAYVRDNPEDAARIIAAAARMKSDAVLHVLKGYPQLVALGPMEPYRKSIALMTQKLLPEQGYMSRPLTDAELRRFTSDFAL